MKSAIQVIMNGATRWIASLFWEANDTLEARECKVFVFIVWFFRGLFCKYMIFFLRLSNLFLMILIWRVNCERFKEGFWDKQRKVVF